MVWLAVRRRLELVSVRVISIVVAPSGSGRQDPEEVEFKFEQN